MRNLTLERIPARILEKGIFHQLWDAAKNVILLSEYSLDGDENQRDKTILHEFAHCWLKHASTVLVEDMTGEEILKQEKEADELVYKWSKRKGVGQGKGHS